MKFLILISLFIVGTQGGFRCTFGNWACTAGCVVLGQTSGKETNSGHFIKIDLWSIYESINNKNAAKRTRQHVGEKYSKAEYVQRHVCFVNEQVP